MAKRTKMKYHLGYNEEGFYFLCAEGTKYEMMEGPIMGSSVDVINKLNDWPYTGVQLEEGDENFNKEWRWSVPKEFL